MRWSTFFFKLPFKFIINSSIPYGIVLDDIKETKLKQLYKKSDG